MSPSPEFNRIVELSARPLLLPEAANDCYLELEVRDDGRGITESEKCILRSLGLLGMKERALLIGGEVKFVGGSGKGTIVVVRVPLDA